MPLSVLTGRSEVMSLLERDVFFFSTFGGEALALAAALATMRTLRDQAVPEYLDRLGTDLRDQYNRLAAELGVPFSRCAGFGCRTLVSFAAEGIAIGDDPLIIKSFVQQELIKRGILWSGFHNLSAAHTAQEIDYLLRAYREVLPLLRAALEKNQLTQSPAGQGEAIRSLCVSTIRRPARVGSHRVDERLDQRGQRLVPAADRGARESSPSRP